jgi:hypothetical protein
MKNPGTKISWLICICLSVCTVSTLAQKNKNDLEPPKVEVKKEDPPPPPPPPAPTKESKPTYEPSDNSSSDNSTSSSTDRREEPQPRTNRRMSRNRAQQKQRRAGQQAEIERRKREARKNNKKKDKEDDYYVNCPTYDPYGDCNNYSDDDNSSSSIDPFSFFNDNDVLFYQFNEFYNEKIAARFQPYFAGSPGLDYDPLYRVSFMEVQTDLPFTGPFWTFYYEPDLDNFYMQFSRLIQNDFSMTGPVKFDRLILRADGKKTTTKVGKSFDYKGKVRPILVEDISKLRADRIYSFNISYLPKGKYEMMFLSRTGTTAILKFKIK